MARLARIVIPDHPHHVTQRGNRRMETFFEDNDYEVYLALLSEWCLRADTEIWGYCLMPNHIHLILVPSHEDGLRAALGEAHRRYTRYVNFKEGWRGYLWQGRFHSFPMDEAYLLACAGYVELNPVRAGLVKRPGDWRWSSAGAHLAAKDDGVVSVAPMLARVPDWKSFLQTGIDDEAQDAIRAHSRTGRPLGGGKWLGKIEALAGRSLRKGKPGPKPKEEAG